MGLVCEQESFHDPNPSSIKQDKTHFQQGMKCCCDGAGQSRPPAIAGMRHHELRTRLSHHHAVVQQCKGGAGGELSCATNFVLFSWLSSLHSVCDVQTCRALIYSSFFTLPFPSGSNGKLVLERLIWSLAHLKTYASRLFHPTTTTCRTVITFSLINSH